MKISVHLKPSSKRGDAVIENDHGSLTVYTKAPAIENKANLAAVTLLAKHFGVAKSRVTLLHGQKSHTKVFQVGREESSSLRKSAKC